MGLGGISPWSLLLILVIVLVLFGTKRLRNMGGDLGGAFKSFKNALRDENTETEAAKEKEATKVSQDNTNNGTNNGRVIDAEVKQKDNV